MYFTKNVPLFYSSDLKKGKINLDGPVLSHSYYSILVASLMNESYGSTYKNSLHLWRSDFEKIKWERLEATTQIPHAGNSLKSLLNQLLSKAHLIFLNTDRFLGSI